jgi:hypothetical protein
VYEEPKPTYYEPKPAYMEPKPTYYEPVYEEPKPSHYEQKPVYDEPKPIYYEPVYEEPKPTYYEPIEPGYNNPGYYEKPVKPPYGDDKDEVCHIKVSVDCKEGSFGGSCQDIHIPTEKQCSKGEPLEALSFKYENAKCNPSGNSQGKEAYCTDKASFSPSDPVNVYCRKASTNHNLVLEPQSVLPGGKFTISNPGSYLPDKVDCIFRDRRGLLVQNTVFDASGTVDLELMDMFGAMTLYSCEAYDCKETLTYFVNIENLGEVPLDIEMVDFLLNDDKYHLLSEMEKRSLGPGESTVVVLDVEVEVCKTGFSYDAYVYVEANPQYGKVCSDDIRYDCKTWLLPARTQHLH